MNFISYRAYYLQSQAEEVFNILEDSGIESTISEEIDKSDNINIENKFKPKYLLKIKPEDIPAADSLLLDISNKQLSNVPKDHYLFMFSNDELYEVVLKKSEWSELDFLLAKHILSTRLNATERNELESSFYSKNKVGNQTETIQNIRTVAVISVIIGLLIITTVWYFTSILNAILCTIAIVAIIYFIRNSYINRLKTLTCPNCGQFGKTKQLSREEKDSMLLPEKLKDKIVVSYKFNCANCNHTWYAIEYEDNPYSVNG
jgi:hypothetical protein